MVQWSKMNLDLDRSSPHSIKRQSEFTGKLLSSSKPYFVEMGHGVGDKRARRRVRVREWECNIMREWMDEWMYTSQGYYIDESNIYINSYNKVPVTLVFSIPIFSQSLCHAYCLSFLGLS